MATGKSIGKSLRFHGIRRALRPALQTRRFDMHANRFCLLRLLSGLLAFVVMGGAHGEGVKLVAQHIETIGARQWLGVAAASFVASTPIIAPMSQRFAAVWSRRAEAAAARKAEQPAERAPFEYTLTDNFA
jgi:hypothetical protein